MDSGPLTKHVAYPTNRWTLFRNFHRLFRSAFERTI